MKVFPFMNPDHPTITESPTLEAALSHPCVTLVRPLPMG
jgi:hypothetical protein